MNNTNNLAITLVAILGTGASGHANRAHQFATDQNRLATFDHQQVRQAQ